MMSTAGVAAQEVRGPLKAGFLHDGQALGGMKACWGGHSELDNHFLNMDPLTMAYGLNPGAQERLAALGHGPKSTRRSGGRFVEDGPPPKPSLPPLALPAPEGRGQHEEDALASGLQRLSVTRAPTPPLTPARSPPGPGPFACPPPSERGARPLPPLPVRELGPAEDETDCEVEFLTSSDTERLLSAAALPDLRPDGPGRRSFRGCGRINYAYFETPAASAADLSRAAEPRPGPPAAPAAAAAAPPLQAHRRLRRSHSGPAGSFSKPAVRGAGPAPARRASPRPDEDKPEVPPRAPIPPRPAKPDYRRWSAEVASSTYSDEDRPPKVPPREPLSRGNSRTPSPKSLPWYLNGVMPPTQSFAPDPKYVSCKALQRQHSEGAAYRAPCILPILEDGRKVSSTHYYLLPERPAYLDKYECYLLERGAAPGPADCGGAAAPEKPDSRPRADPGGPPKRKHPSCVVSP